MSRKAPDANEHAGRLVCVGEISRPHGVRGDVRINVSSSDPHVLTSCQTVIIDSPTGVRATAVVAVRRLRGSFVITLEGIENRAGAESLRGARILVPCNALPTLARGEFYDFDLVGLSVRSREGEDLGRVIAVEHPPANDTVIINLPNDTYLDLPLVDLYVVDIDLSSGVMTVDLPDGLPTRATR